MTNATTEPKSFPMPLWLQGILEALAAAFISAGIIVVPLAIMWLTGAFAELSLGDAGALGAYVWLASAGVPLQLLSPEAQEVVGTWWFIPLGLLLVWLLLARRAGKRLAKASRLKTLWQPTSGAIAAFVFFAWGTNTLVSMDAVELDPTLAVIMPSLVFTTGYTWGALGYFRHPIAEYLGQRVEQLTDSARNFWHYVWALLRAAVIAVAAAWAIAAILVTVQLGIHWADVADVYQRLDAGIFGGLIITVLQIAILPNLVAWTISYLTGAGFSIGATEISPAGTVAEAQPALPILAAVPLEQNLEAHWWVLCLLLVGGLVAGWWFFGIGENHLEDFIIAKIPNYPTAISIAVITTGATIGITAGLFYVGILWLANGSWAIGSLSEVGAPLWISAGLFAAHIGIGSAIGYALAPLRHKAIFKSPRVSEH
jgi:hypothetical protein